MILCKVSSDRVRGLVDYQSLVPIMLRVDERSDNDWVDERSDNVYIVTNRIDNLDLNI